MRERPTQEKGRFRLTTLVARREYLRTVRRRGYIFGTLLLPFGIAALMAISTIFSVDSFEGEAQVGGTVVIVNSSDVVIQDVFSGPVQVSSRSADEAAALLDAGSISEYYVLPGDFRAERKVTRVEPDSGLSISRLESQEGREGLLRFLIGSALLQEAGLELDEANALLQGVTITAVTTAGDEVSGIDIAAGIVVPMLFVAIFMISIFITSGYLLQSVTEEKENRVVEIVLSSIPSMPLMAGKILGLGGAGLTQVAIWVTTALVAIPLLSSQVPDLGPVELDPTILVLALVYFVLGYLAYGAIFAAIGAISPGNREAQQYSGFLGFFAAVPFILFSVFLTDLTSPIVLALTLFPLTTPTAMLLVLGLSETIPWTMVGASLTSLSLFAILATWASARIFRATVLLYGVRPSLRQLVAAIRSPR